MRQRTKDREAAIRNMTRLGIAPGDQAKLLRLGATLHRLAEAECHETGCPDAREHECFECGSPVRYRRETCEGCRESDEA